jgi:hypothetical protein
MSIFMHSWEGNKDQKDIEKNHRKEMELEKRESRCN